MAATGFAITISAADRATSVIDGINKSLQGIAAPVSRLQGSLAELGDLTGITKMGKGLGGLTGMLGGLVKDFAKVGGAAAGLGSLATIGGIVALEDKFSKLSLTLTNNSRLLGMAPVQLGRVTNALKLLNPALSDEGIKSGIEGMQDVGAEAAFGQNGNAAGTLMRAAAAAHIKDWRDLTKDQRAEFTAVGQYMKSMVGPYAAVARRRVAASVGMPEDFIGASMQGGKALQDALNQAGKNSPTASQISDGTALAKNLELMQQRISGLTTTIADKLSPVANTIADKIGEWASDANDFIKTKTGVKGVFQAIGLEINDLEKKIPGLKDAIDGLEDASLAASIAGPFIALEGAISALTGGGKGSLSLLKTALKGMGFKFAEDAPGMIPPGAAPGVAATAGRVAKKGFLAAGAELFGVYEAASWALKQGADIPSPWTNGWDPLNKKGGKTPDVLGPTPPSPANPKSAIAQLFSGADMADPVSLAESQMGKTSGGIGGYLAAGGVKLDAARDSWCAAFVNSSLAQVGIKGTGSNVATDFSKWGIAGDPNHPARDDIGVLMRGLNAGQVGGHVGFLTGLQKTVKGVLYDQLDAGNEGDGPHGDHSVQQNWYPASDITARKAPLTVQPAPVAVAQVPDDDTAGWRQDGGGAKPPQFGPPIPANFNFTHTHIHRRDGSVTTTTRTSQNTSGPTSSTSMAGGVY